jgi:hypothetical protein
LCRAEGKQQGVPGRRRGAGSDEEGPIVLERSIVIEGPAVKGIVG